MEWNTDAQELLDELVSPIPVFVRPMARKGIEKKIAEVAEGSTITKDDVVKGYILASPGKMQDRAVKLLQAKKVDLTPYQSLLEETK
ncbi:DUF2621 family protein [Anaerobacillus sp. MEB173]|uniref:DUF2621 family protein n=1 Tax=Anaerobacillus sp. MEB173 TaxID=3383345 RepID=UPI003F91FAF6